MLYGSETWAANTEQVARLSRAEMRMVRCMCGVSLRDDDDDDVVFYATHPIFMGLGQCPIVNWDFAGAVSIFGPDALPVIHQ